MNSQFEYKDAMNALHYTDAQKALLAERAAQAAQTARRTERRIRGRQPHPGRGGDSRHSRGGRGDDSGHQEGVTVH